MTKYRFENTNWFDVVVEAESYEHAVKVYNQIRKKGHKI